MAVYDHPTVVGRPTSSAPTGNCASTSVQVLIVANVESTRPTASTCEHPLMPMAHEQWLYGWACDTTFKAVA